MARRAALLVSAALALAVGVPAAHADCGTQILGDYLADGKVDGRYPVACYRRALAEMPGDVRAYSNAQTALTAAMARDRSVTAMPASGDAADAPIARELGDVGPRRVDDVPTSALLATGLALLVGATGAGGIIARRRARSDRDA